MTSVRCLSSLGALALLVALVAVAKPSAGQSSRAFPVAPAKITSIDVDPYYPDTPNDLIVWIRGESGAPCGLAITLTLQETGMVLRQVQNTPNKIPHGFQVTFASVVPAGHYVITATAAPYDINNPTVPGCRGSATFALHLTDAMLKKKTPSPYVEFMRWEGARNDYYLLFTDHSQPMTVVTSSACTATLEIRNTWRNVTSRWPYTFTGQSIDVAALINSQEAGITAINYELTIHSTPLNASLPGPFCLGEAKGMFRPVTGTLIRTPLAYRFPGAGQGYHAHFHAKVDGARACAYTIEVVATHPPPTTNMSDPAQRAAWEKGKGGGTFHVVHPASGPEPEVTFDVFGAHNGARYSVRVHSTPEDRARGPACAGDTWRPEFQFDHE